MGLGGGLSFYACHSVALCVCPPFPEFLEGCPLSKSSNPHLVFNMCWTCTDGIFVLLCYSPVCVSHSKSSNYSVKCKLSRLMGSISLLAMSSKPRTFFLFLQQSEEIYTVYNRQLEGITLKLIWGFLNRIHCLLLNNQEIFK